MFVRIAAVASTLMALVSSAHALQLQCHEDRTTQARQCVAPSEVKEKDGIRVAPLYTGGPNNVRATSFTVHVNCKTSVMHIKDRDGVSFAGGVTNTRATRDLEEIICDVKKPKK